MTLAEQCLAHLKLGLTTTQVAAKLGCRPEYVRTVRQRALHGGHRPCDLRAVARRSAAEKMVSLDQREPCRFASRRAYSAARAIGKASAEARGIGVKVYRRELRRLARLTATPAGPAVKLIARGAHQ